MPHTKINIHQNAWLFAVYSTVFVSRTFIQESDFHWTWVSIPSINKEIFNSLDEWIYVRLMTHNTLTTHSCSRSGKNELSIYIVVHSFPRHDFQKNIWMLFCFDNWFKCHTFEHTRIFFQTLICKAAVSKSISILKILFCHNFS